jgi:hypothetical protein
VRRDPGDDGHGGRRRTRAKIESYRPKSLPTSTDALISKHNVVTSERPCRGLQLTSPAQFEQFVAERGRPAEALTLPEPTPPDIAALAATAERYGHEFVGPPLSIG